MLTEFRVSSDVPGARVSGGSEPCGAVGTSANPWHLGIPPLFELVFEKVRKKGITAALIPLWRLYISLRARRRARAARGVASAAVEFDFNEIARSARGSGARPPSPLRGDDQ